MMSHADGIFPWTASCQSVDEINRVQFERASNNESALLQSSLVHVSPHHCISSKSIHYSIIIILGNNSFAIPYSFRF